MEHEGTILLYLHSLPLSRCQLGDKHQRRENPCASRGHKCSDDSTQTRPSTACTRVGSFDNRHAINSFLHRDLVVVSKRFTTAHNSLRREKSRWPIIQSHVTFSLTMPLRRFSWVRFHTIALFTHQIPFARQLSFLCSFSFTKALLVGAPDVFATPHQGAQTTTPRHNGAMQQWNCSRRLNPLYPRT